MIKYVKYLILFLSFELLSNAALAETIDQKLEKIRNRQDFIYSADPDFLHSSFAMFRAMNSVLEAIKKNETFSRKKIKDVIVRKRESVFRITLFPYDSYDLLNAINEPVIDMTAIVAIVDSKTYEIKELELCSGECGIYK